MFPSFWQKKYQKNLKINKRSIFSNKWRPSWISDRHLGHNFERAPYWLHSYQVLLELAWRFWRRRFFCLFAIFSNGGHLGGRGQTPNTIFKGPHLIYIPAKFQWNWISSFRGDVENKCWAPKGRGPFIWTNLKGLHPGTIPAKFDRIWFSGFGEEVV